MSKAYKCDRCGCYFSEKKTLYLGTIMVVADFCPECARSLEKWFKMDNADETDVKCVNTDTAFCGLQSAT